MRETLGIGFVGGTYEHLFYVADVKTSGPVANGELHVALDTTDFLAVFPLKADGHARLIGTDQCPHNLAARLPTRQSRLVPGRSNP